MQGRLNRRAWFASVGAVAGLAAGAPRTGSAQARPAAGAQSAERNDTLLLKDFQPRSMLVVPQHPVERAKFPVVDVHTHPTFRSRSVQGVPQGEAVTGRAPAAELMSLMDKRNLRTLVNLTGGVGSGLAETIKTLQQPHPDRFAIFTEPSYERIVEPRYAAWQADELGRAKQAGAKGLKILKVLGLFLRERVDTGPLVKVDDPRFDPMWDACGSLGLPVAIHVSDPTAFFLPIDAHNERYEELHRHPDWSFHGKDYPVERRDSRRPRSGARTTSEDHLHRSPRGATRRRICRRRRRLSIAFPTWWSRLPRASASSDGSRARRSASSTGTRTGFSSAPTVQATRYTQSTSGSSRPRTSTSTTARAPCRPRGDGRSTASV